MMESALLSAAGLAARSIHLHISPTARTFSERHEVLRVLERFGEVIMFRSLKYHPISPAPNAFMAIYLEPGSVEEIVTKSPLRYRIISDKSPPSKLSRKDTGGSKSPQDSSKTDISQSDRIFELSANRSDFDHLKYISDTRFNPLHGHFRPETRSAFSSSLARILPETLWTEGLMDWETDSLRRRKWVEERNKEDGSLVRHMVGVRDDHHRRMVRSQARSTGLKHEIPWRLQIKRMRERELQEQDKVPRVMRGLKSLWEEGERARAREEHAKALGT